MVDWRIAMRMLVAYASRRGATEGIAERIAVTLEALGLDVTFKPCHEVGRIDDFDAFVVGSSAYFGHWEPEAAAFVRQHSMELAERPIWLFSSGPVGPDAVDKQGRPVIEASVPAEFSEFDGLVHPRDLQVFFGAYDPAGKGANFVERFVAKVPAIGAAMPTGDFRDWPVIEAWAKGIAAELGAMPAPTPATVA
jgi:menaquinone-dependent protoporphyrinogen oxidase